MELSMAMRFVRVRANQKANKKTVYAEHTLSALLLLAGTEAAAVMPSGSEAQKAAIANEKADLSKALDEMYGLGDPLMVMARLDELIAGSSLDTGAEREYAALQTDAERWMEENPSYGNTIVPVAMLHAVYAKADMIVDEAFIGAGVSASGAAARSISDIDPMATVVDTPVIDPMATVVDTPVIDPMATAVDIPPIDLTGTGMDPAADEKPAPVEYTPPVPEKPAPAVYTPPVPEKPEPAVYIPPVPEAPGPVFYTPPAPDSKKAMKNASVRAFAAFIVFVVVVVAAWQVYLRSESFGADPSVWWMKLFFFIVYLVAFIASIGKINALQHSPDLSMSQTTMMRVRVIGTAPMIFFKLVIISTIVPAVLMLIVQLALGELTPFWMHFFTIYGFCWLCGLINCAFQSNVAALSVGYLDYGQLKKKKGALVGQLLSGTLMVPAVVFFLHWHFDWFPMKTWVIVLLVIYLVFALAGTAMASRAEAGALQNDI